MTGPEDPGKTAQGRLPPSSDRVRATGRARHTELRTTLEVRQSSAVFEVLSTKNEVLTAGVPGPAGRDFHNARRQRILRDVNRTNSPKL